MFSVIIPLYNKEKSIESTIQSVLDQSFQGFEIVVVNDGSTDNSIGVVEQMNVPNLRIIHQENQGVSAARNKGIKEGKNHWIAFLDGDDIWEKNHLEEMKNLIEKYPDKQFFATSFARSDGKEIKMWKPEVDDYVVPNYFTGMLRQHLVSTIVLVIHRSVFDMMKGFDPHLTIGEDLDLWGRIGKLLPLVKSNKVTALYRLDAENRTAKIPTDFKRSIFSKIDLKSEMGDDERWYYRTLIVNMMKASIRQKNWKMFFKLLKKYNFQLI